MAKKDRSLAERYHKARKLFLDTFDEIQGNDEKPWKLRNWARKNPKEFYEMILKVIPREIDLGNKDEGTFKVTWMK